MTEEPTERDDGWYVTLDDGAESGPWATEAAATAAADGNFIRAHILHYREEMKR